MMLRNYYRFFKKQARYVAKFREKATFSVIKFKAPFTAYLNASNKIHKCMQYDRKHQDANLELSFE